VQEEHYGRGAWINPLTDTVRREECLCLNCDNLKTDPNVKNCPIAQKFYETCEKEKSLALMVTRCPRFKNRKLGYPGIDK
jgi:hypothetical protein